MENMTLRTGYIYRIYSTVAPECYIGSTYHPVNRKAAHYYSCVNPCASHHHLKVYKYMRLHGVSNFNFQILKEIPNCDKKRLRQNEQSFVDAFEPKLNMLNPLGHDKKYYNDLRKHKHYTCSCGSHIKWRERARHFRSKSHLKFLSNQSKQKEDTDIEDTCKNGLHYSNCV